jgi:amino acid transporter
VVIYLMLEVAFIGALNPQGLVHGWANPIGKGDFGPYATLATALGAGWLATVLYIDAVVSPAGTGLIYVATSSRLSYAMGHERALPRLLSKIDIRGVPLQSVLLAFIVGEVAFLPFPSWQSLVGLVTSATAIMYAFAPVSLHALRLRDGERSRPYQLPAWRLLSPSAFIAANLIIYWSGYEADWKLGITILIGLVVFGLVRLGVPAAERSNLQWRSALWVWPWLAGLIVIGHFGRYGGTNALGNWWDLLVVVAFSLVVYLSAVRLALSSEDMAAAVASEARAEYPDGLKPA